MPEQTSTTYRLPETLGGGTVEAYHQRQDPPSAGFYLEGEVIWVPLSLLIEVKPPLPDEPDRWAVVEVTTNDAVTVVFQRIPETSADVWAQPGLSDQWSWAEVCEMSASGPPRRLVPDPFAEPVELPWKATDGGAEVEEAVGCGCHGEEDGARLIRVSMDTPAHLESGAAREFARALWAAADKAEASHVE